MAFFANLLLFLALSLSIGLGSAWYALENGLPIMTRKAGPWLIWQEAGSSAADPYTTAFVARSGWLPITSSHALYYIAKTDSSNRALKYNCDYRLSGKSLEAEWWTLGLFDQRGNVIKNKAQRYAFNSTNTVRNSDGSFRISLSSEVQPGNWLPAMKGTHNILVLRILGPKKTEDAQAVSELEQRLPKIERLACH